MSFIMCLLKCSTLVVATLQQIETFCCDTPSTEELSFNTYQYDSFKLQNNLFMVMIFLNM